MSEAKRCRRAVATSVETLPADLFYLMMTFVGDSMNEFVTYTRVSHAFRRAIHSTTMLSRLRWDVRNPLKIRFIPAMMSTKVHHVRMKKSHATLDNLSYVPQLRVLDLSSYNSHLKDEHITAVQELSFLHTINVTGNRSLTNLDMLEDMPSLRRLIAMNCPGLTRLPRMPSLTTLCIENSYGFKDLQVLALMPNLEELRLQLHCVDKALFDLMPVGLRKLKVAYCPNLTDNGLHYLARLANLTDLNLGGCSEIESLRNLVSLAPHLEKLDVSMCKALRNLDGLSAFKSLRLLYAPFTPLGSKVSLEGLVSLEELEFSSKELTMICFPHPLPKMHTITLHCPLLQHMVGVHNASNVCKLDLSNSRLVDNALLGKLQPLSRLQNLDLQGCLLVTFIGLELLPRTLTRLILKDCVHVCDVAMERLSRFSALKRLDLQKCTKISDEGFHELSALKAVRYLNLSFCVKLTDTGMFALSKLAHLRVLRLAGCRKVTDLGLRALSHLTELQSLDFNRCKRLDTLKPLRSLTSLRYIDLSGCVKLTDDSLRNLSLCIDLETIRTTHCKLVSKSFVDTRRKEIARARAL